VNPDTPDGLYVVKIDNVPGSAPDDLDTWLQDAINWLVANDPFIDGSSVLLGAAIKGGVQDTLFYAIDGDTDSDPFPGDLSGDGPGGNVPPGFLDQTYLYSAIFP
jgi:hypothetical protein